MKSSILGMVLGTMASLASGSDFFPTRPPAIPLAVRSPYMQTWLESGSVGGSGGILPGYWPGPQPGDVSGGAGSVTAWAGLIKVDGTAYTWMGAASVNGVIPPSVTQTRMEYTSTRSTFLMNVAGKVSMNVSFISPINPTDLKRQSIVGTYLDVSVVSIDGATHAVQLYADISAEWASIHSSDTAQWNYTTDSGIGTHRVWRQNQSEFNEDYADDAAHWGYYLWSTEAVQGMTFQSGQDVAVRQAFLSNGSLAGTQDTSYRAISDNWPVFAYANNLGNVGSTPVATLYTIVHSQQRAIYFNGASGLVGVPSLWTSYWSNDLAAVSYFYGDWATQNGALDAKIAADSLAAGGQDYLTITSLSARQAFGAVQLCGTPDKLYYFLKEISSDGNIQTVDVMFPAMPIFLYTNPVLVKYLLDPLFENQEAGLFPQTYAIHDLGASYPRAVGHPTGDGEPMPLEECGNMIIMALAYAQRTSDTAYLSKHYPILKQWTGYLVSEALIPANQLSTDDFQGTLANQTNLALKGIIAIEAMSVVAKLTGNTADAQNYTNIAHSYLTQWEGLAIVNATASAPAHTKLAYQDATGHGLLYNLYADRLLNLNFVPQRIYDMQSAFYPTVAHTYGVPLDSRNVATKSDWEMWVAAISSASTKSMFISKLATWIATTPTDRAFSDLQNTDTADFWSGPFIARPVVGGHFALLALNGASGNTTKPKPKRDLKCSAQCVSSCDVLCEVPENEGTVAVTFRA
ncbi:putative glutaminase protein [Rutstroemia sp. NJR-2017a WRK4]|nr:putative glutaminase protein [Rutstroemia sp. NJR-2017a WRK4]